VSKRAHFKQRRILGQKLLQHSPTTHKHVHTHTHAPQPVSFLCPLPSLSFSASLTHRYTHTHTQPQAAPAHGNATNGLDLCEFPVGAKWERRSGEETRKEPNFCYCGSLLFSTAVFRLLLSTAALPCSPLLLCCSPQLQLSTGPPLLLFTAAAFTACPLTAGKNPNSAARTAVLYCCCPPAVVRLLLSTQHATHTQTTRTHTHTHTRARRTHARTHTHTYAYREVRLECTLSPLPLPDRDRTPYAAKEKPKNSSDSDELEWVSK
jgi:hypothetical protein